MCFLQNIHPQMIESTILIFLPTKGVFSNWPLHDPGRLFMHYLSSVAEECGTIATPTLSMFLGRAILLWILAGHIAARILAT